MRPFRFVGALALALISRAAFAQAAMNCEISHQTIQAHSRFDPGGFLDDYIDFAARARRRHQSVSIPGECDSACVIKLSVGRTLCINPSAKIGVHEARSGGTKVCATYLNGHRDEAATRDYRASMPACARHLFDSRNAFASGNLTYFSGAEVLAACPQIRSCGAKHR
jgi:hypothetical protein